MKLHVIGHTLQAGYNMYLLILICVRTPLLLELWSLLLHPPRIQSFCRHPFTLHLLLPVLLFLMCCIFLCWCFIGRWWMISAFAFALVYMYAHLLVLTPRGGWGDWHTGAYFGIEKLFDLHYISSGGNCAGEVGELVPVLFFSHQPRSSGPKSRASTSSRSTNETY